MFFILELLLTLVAYVSFMTDSYVFISLASLCIFVIILASLINAQKNKKVVLYIVLTILLIFLSVISIVDITDIRITRIITCFCGINAVFIIRDYLLASMMIQRRDSNVREH